jgi:hypothetical protein
MTQEKEQNFYCRLLRPQQASGDYAGLLASVVETDVALSKIKYDVEKRIAFVAPYLKLLSGDRSEYIH